jgi:hypothetical protein
VCEMEPVRAPLGPPLFSRERLERYATVGMNEVHGWLAPLAATLVQAIGKIQDEQHIAGSVAEIGVHHGRLFILMYLLLRRGERALAIDLFSQQSRNVDGSGRGDLARFLENVRTHAGESGGLTCLEADSTELTGDDLLPRLERAARLFSVDGGHTAALTENDLALGEACLADEGVLILDDYFNQAWPGVSEGTNRFFARGSSELRPVAIGGNKILFAKLDRAQWYRALLADALADCLFKRSFFLDEEVLIMLPSTAPQMLRRRRQG